MSIKYEVSVHYHGRRIVRRGPCEGLLDWPAHRWECITQRPLGFARAIALADAQASHAIVSVWRVAETVHDNGRPAGVPAGWWPVSAESAREVRP